MSNQEHLAPEQGDLSQYLLESRSEILFLLRSLVQKKCLLTVYFDHGQDFFLTPLLAISEDGNWIYLDVASEQEVNRRALEARHFILTTMLEKVKIQFSLDGVQEVSANGRPAFAAHRPETLLRLQRREHFRLDAPIAHPVKCVVEAPLPDIEQDRHELVILDISGGGVGLMVPDEIEQAFLIGNRLGRCQMELPEEGRIITELCVRNAFRITNKAGKQYLRAGCEYLNLPGTALPIVQRYINRLERERKLRESGSG